MKTESKPSFSQKRARWIMLLNGSLDRRKIRAPKRILFFCFTGLRGHLGYNLLYLHVMYSSVDCYENETPGTDSSASSTSINLDQLRFRDYLMAKGARNPHNGLSRLAFTSTNFPLSLQKSESAVLIL